jgi:hypothetical protein
MSELDESMEQRLSRLSEQTRGIVARGDLAQRVLARVEAERALFAGPDWPAQVMGLARLGVVVASIAAAAVLGVALDRSSSADQEEALAYGVVEAFE